MKRRGTFPTQTSTNKPKLRPERSKRSHGNPVLRPILHCLNKFRMVCCRIAEAISRLKHCLRCSQSCCEKAFQAGDWILNRHVADIVRSIFAKNVYKMAVLGCLVNIICGLVVAAGRHFSKHLLIQELHEGHRATLLRSCFSAFQHGLQECNRVVGFHNSFRPQTYTASKVYIMLASLTAL